MMQIANNKHSPIGFTYKKCQSMNIDWHFAATVTDLNGDSGESIYSNRTDSLKRQ